jgi:hypothetical protein
MGIQEAARAGVSPAQEGILVTAARLGVLTTLPGIVICALHYVSRDASLILHAPSYFCCTVERKQLIRGGLIGHPPTPCSVDWLKSLHFHIIFRHSIIHSKASARSAGKSTQS